ncbi:MAG: hypothetical protein CL526_09750 [Aequorivita sp.]|nr:hypothetical protein [Aequorivita sp.]|tara:strand:- start:20003 stop:20440 length:438 start_codon:yes stop_codon:yes gene_type:complete
MELDKIKQLLTAYFEGNTSLAEDNILIEYFNSDNIDNSLLEYGPIFKALKTAKTESTNRSFSIEKSQEKKLGKRWYAAAATIVVLIGVGAFYFSQPQYTQEEKEALMAFNESKRALLLLSENLNKGAEQLTFVHQFNKTKNRIFE